MPPAGDVPDQQEGVRTFRPVDPASRPVRVRRTARVLLVDDAGRLLLFCDSDPGLPGTTWWITPGGGVEPGETDLEGAVREVAEETGLAVDPDRFRGPLARRHVRHGYTDVVVVQDEVFFAATVPAFDVDVAGHTEEERLTMTAHRWWTREELAGTTETVWPESVLDLWDRMDAGAPEVDLGTQEESTVPVRDGHVG
jgi:8-oxo-dGTP pyrophosphatase MutT (NUDIX family)